MRRFRHRAIPTGAAICVISGSALIGVLGGFGAPHASADTDPAALVGEGGSFLSPVTNLLLNADSGLSPLNPQYSNSDLDSAVTDFVGSAPGQFNADFVVSERPLTTTEATTAAANGRSFAYVPFAATPVAISTFAVCNPLDLADDSLSATTFCRNMPLTPTLVGELFLSGLVSTSVQPNTNLPASLMNWNDSRLTQASGLPVPDGAGVVQASNLTPSAENSALMSLFDSDPTAKELLDNALANPVNAANTTSDVPSEIWPFHGVHAYVGGDQGLLEKELTVDATTGAPSTVGNWGALGPDDGGNHDVFPVSAVWVGSPLGTPWNVPTANIQNAQGAFVGPTLGAATAAESGTGITLDPATNLVTFNPDTSDAMAYNNYLMVESYLVVPTSGLDAAKAIKLAQFIRFVLGPTGQSNIKVLGAAPATPAEVTAGLKVASELDAEASVGSTTASSTTSTTTPVSTTGTTTPGSTTGTTMAPDSLTADSPDASADQGSSELASTGDDPVPLVVLGVALAGVSTLCRRRLRRRSAAS